MTQPAVIGSAIAASASAAVLTLSAIPVTTGGAIVVFTALGGVSGVTDSQHNVYTLLQVVASNVSVWMAFPAVGSPSVTVTVTFTGAVSCAAGAISIFPVGSPGKDAVGSGTTGTTSPAGDTVVAAGSNDLILEAVMIQSVVTFAGGGGSTVLKQVSNPTALFTFALVSLPATVPNPYTPQAGFGGGPFSWVALAAAFLATASPPALVADASGTPLSGTKPLTVAFSGSAHGGTGPYSYSWAFGDGGVSSAQNPSHTYTTVGGYTATLTVTDSVPNTAHASVTPIVVSAPAADPKQVGGAVPSRIRPANVTGLSSRKIRLP